MRAPRHRHALLVALSGLLLAGCGAVEFDHPLSDEKTSVVDERLIGFWEPTEETVGTAHQGEGMLIPRLAVGRDREQGKLMEALSLEMEDDGTVTVKRLALRATKIGAHHYLSVKDTGESTRWWVVRYDLPEKDLLRLWFPDQDAFAKAVKAGELAGEVRRRETGNELGDLEVRVTSPPTAVRAWLEAHADTCVMEDSAAMRHLVKKIPEVEALERKGPDEEHDTEGE